LKTGGFPAFITKLNGIEVATEIRKQPKASGKTPYIIMVTSKSGQENMLLALEAGVDDFISKPIDSSILISRIKVVERQRKELTTNAMSILMEEHIALARMSRVFETLAEKIGKNPLSNALLEWVSSTAIMLDTKVHHKKEDIFMMIFLERVLKEHGESPNSRIFSRTSLKTIEDEHEELKIILADIQNKVKWYLEKKKGADLTLKKAINDYVHLLQIHMEREDKYLFPLSYKYLTEDDMGRMLAEFENVELKVGIKKLDKRLEQIIKAEAILNIK
ncbi:MAG: hemerythrin domain-containing protein, partial [Candidatus Thermoplasmatota archaeon]|nr:hemerythrin domain-containing protein [Candidatus Thermoplasmatota archaeon]